MRDIPGTPECSCRAPIQRTTASALPGWRCLIRIVQPSWRPSCLVSKRLPPQCGIQPYRERGESMSLCARLTGIGAVSVSVMQIRSSEPIWPRVMHGGTQVLT